METRLKQEKIIPAMITMPTRILAKRAVEYTAEAEM